ncbi:hypothetical protein [Brevibacterium aurantiacum]|nr:hypothetical protein [Brevibacterium aurantiacum]
MNANQNLSRDRGRSREVDDLQRLRPTWLMKSDDLHVDLLTTRK